MRINPRRVARKIRAIGLPGNPPGEGLSVQLYPSEREKNPPNQRPLCFLGNKWDRVHYFLTERAREIGWGKKLGIYFLQKYKSGTVGWIKFLETIASHGAWSGWVETLAKAP